MEYSIEDVMAHLNKVVGYADVNVPAGITGPSRIIICENAAVAAASRIAVEDTRWSPEVLSHLVAATMAGYFPGRYQEGPGYRTIRDAQEASHRVEVANA